jgi:hypothetical protein
MSRYENTRYKYKGNLIISIQTICFIFITSRPTLEHTQPHTQWVSGALSPGVKLQGREADHSYASSEEIMNGGTIPPLPHMASCHSA